MTADFADQTRHLSVEFVESVQSAARDSYPGKCRTAGTDGPLTPAEGFRGPVEESLLAMAQGRTAKEYGGIASDICTTLPKRRAYVLRVAMRASRTRGERHLNGVLFCSHTSVRAM